MCKVMKAINGLSFYPKERIERLRSFVCGDLCNGHCRPEYIGKSISSKPECYTPNKDPYHLCIGSKDPRNDCRTCNLYENMDEENY